MTDRFHEQRYTGWDEEDVEDGYVRRYDTINQRWVTLDFDEIPDEILERYRPDRVVEPSSVPSTTGEITDVELVLEPDGAKYRIDTFELEIRNTVRGPLTVDRVLLHFDGEEKAAPRNPIEIDPFSTARLQVHWDWIYPDQTELTIECKSGRETVATGIIDLRSKMG